MAGTSGVDFGTLVTIDIENVTRGAIVCSASLGVSVNNIKLNKQRALVRYAGMSPMRRQSVNRWLQW